MADPSTLESDHTHVCTECGERYNPSDDISREASFHLSARNRYETYAASHCYGCHLGTGPDSPDQHSH